MKMKKLVSLLTALALSASMAVLPSFADDNDQAVALTGDAVTVTALPKDTPITFGTAASYTANTKVGDYLAVYASTYIKEDNTEGKRNIDIDTTGKTIGGVAYPGRLKTGGAAYKGEVTDEDYGTIKSRVISVTPAEDGTLSIIFAHASSSGSARQFAINQSGKEIAVEPVEPSEVKTIKANVAANVPVYIYSKSSGINIYSIELGDLDTSTPTPEPTEIPVTKLPKDTHVKFETEKSITATELYNDYTIVYVGTGDSVTVDASNKTIDGRTYSTRLKLSSGRPNSSGVLTSRAFSLTPAADGILKVDFAATNSTDAKSLTAIQEGSETVTENVEADGTATLSMAVKADVPVYVYGANGANVYGYILLDASAEIVPSPMPLNTTVTFDDGIDTDYNTTSAKALYGNYVLVIPKAGDSSKTKIEASSKTIPEDGTRYTATLKLGGKGSKSERAVEIIPAAAGTLKVPFVHASSNAEAENAVLKAYQNGAVIGSQEVAQSAANGAVLEAAVEAGKPVYIYSETEGSNLYAIILTGSEEPSATAEPGSTTAPAATAEPGSTAAPTAEPSSTTAPVTDKVRCVKIVATYSAGALTNVAIEPGEYAPAEMADYNNINNDTTKTFFWKAISGEGAMEPVNVPIPIIPAPTATPATEPETTAEPQSTEAPVVEPEWDWVAASDANVEADAAKEAADTTRTIKSGYVLISGLTTLFDNTSTNKAYIAGAATGEWSEPDSTSEKYNKASMLKYVPTKDGVLYIKIDKLDAGKQAAIFESGLSQTQIQNDPSYINAEKNLTNVIVKREVEAGKTYLVTVKAGTGRYNAAAFVEQAVSKTWSGANKAENITAGTELFSGLTTLFDDVSAADKKYISGDTNPTVNTETGEVTGSALQFVAPANGTISVTITGLGADKSAAIYDKAAKTEIDPQTNDGSEKVDITLSATVEAGKTYYIMGKGTNACYSAASFTPASN